jgi:hypothetical protein
VKLKAVDIVAGLSYVASGGLAAAFVAVSQAYPKDSTAILGYGAIATGLAGLLVRLFSNKTGSPATSVIANAPAVSPTTGAQVGTIDHTP